jgi:hypothetical protein
MTSALTILVVVMLAASAGVMVLVLRAVLVEMKSEDSGRTPQANRGE